MTTEITFEEGENLIIPDGGYANGAINKGLGEIVISDRKDYGYASIYRIVYYLGRVSEGEVITKQDLLKKIPSLNTQIKEIRYLGKSSH